MTSEQVMQKHPAPWRYVSMGNNLVMIDARGQQVELFTMLDFCVAVTTNMVAARVEPTSAPL